MKINFHLQFEPFHLSRMASSAEESLMALLEAMLTLAASEVIRPKPPAVKPGGYPEEHFLDLTDEEKDEFSCNIW